MVDFGNFSSPDSFKNDAFVYFLFRPKRVTFQRIFSLESKTNVLSPQALFVKVIRPYNRQFVKKAMPNYAIGHRCTLHNVALPWDLGVPYLIIETCESI